MMIGIYFFGFMVLSTQFQHTSRNDCFHEILGPVNGIKELYKLNEILHIAVIHYLT